METESCPDPWARVHRTPSDQLASLALSRRAHSETEAKVALQMALALSGIVASPPNPKGGSWLSAPKSTGSWPGAWRAGPPLQVRLLCSELHPPHGRPFPTYDLLWALDLSMPRCLPPAGSQRSMAGQAVPRRCTHVGRSPCLSSWHLQLGVQRKEALESSRLPSNGEGSQAGGRRPLVDREGNSALLQGAVAVPQQSLT